MKKIHLEAINRKLEENEKAFIEKGEDSYRAQIEKIAESITSSGKKKPIILLSGPSGAGKTTTALRLEEYLDNKGLETHTISMDNYFLPVDSDNIARDENGEIDFESPYRLDIPLLNDHMLKLANCEEIEIPGFDFEHQQRIKGKTLKRNHGEIIIFEGIHALNPEVTGLTDSFASCVYVSVRTRVEAASGRIMHPSHIRLMRRLIRDKFFRARDPEHTLGMFASVERGENKYIMPYKYRAEYSVDTFMPYELSVYKNYIADDLRKVSERYIDFEGLDLMSEVLDEIDPVAAQMVPEDSLVREVIGGSRLAY